MNNLESYTASLEARFPDPSKVRVVVGMSGA